MHEPSLRYTSRRKQHNPIDPAFFPIAHAIAAKYTGRAKQARHHLHNDAAPLHDGPNHGHGQWWIQTANKYRLFLRIDLHASRLYRYSFPSIDRKKKTKSIGASGETNHSSLLLMTWLAEHRATLNCVKVSRYSDGGSDVCLMIHYCVHRMDGRATRARINELSERQQLTIRRCSCPHLHTMQPGVMNYS